MEAEDLVLVDDSDRKAQVQLIGCLTFLAKGPIRLENPCRMGLHTTYPISVWKLANK